MESWKAACIIKLVSKDLHVWFCVYVSHLCVDADLGSVLGADILIMCGSSQRHLTELGNEIDIENKPSVINHLIRFLHTYAVVVAVAANHNWRCLIFA